MDTYKKLKTFSMKSNMRIYAKQSSICKIFHMLNFKNPYFLFEKKSEYN